MENCCEGKREICEKCESEIFHCVHCDCYFENTCYRPDLCIDDYDKKYEEETGSMYDADLCGKCEFKLELENNVTDCEIVDTAKSLLENYYKDELKSFSESINDKMNRKEMVKLLKGHMLYSLLVFKNIDHVGLDRDGLQESIDSVIEETYIY